MVFSKSEFLRDAESFLNDAKEYNGDLAARMALRKRLDFLKLQLEHPMDNMVNHWESVNAVAVLNFMVETGIFEKLPHDNSITSQEISSLSDVEESVIVRLMRVLVNVGIIAQTGEETFSHTPRSREYLNGAAVDFFRLSLNLLPTYLSFPKYFSTHKSSDLVDPKKTPFSCAQKSEGKTFYEILSENPAQHDIFNKAMKQQEPFLPTLGMFPFSSLEEQVNSERDRPFIVDIGGGRGHMLRIIQKETSGGFGAKMILQDIPEVINSVSLEDTVGIEAMAYDFHTPQPIKNAHIYYLRRILHNHQDGVCIEILKNIAVAMGPTSRVLIGEIVVPSMVQVGGEMTAYWKDVAMLAIGGKERSRKNFAEILDAAGLHLVKVWPFETGDQAVIEARLKAL